MKKSLFFMIIILVLSLYGNQDQEAILKGQLKPATKIVRSEKLFRQISRTTIFEEDFESGGGSWSLSGEWEVGFPTTGPNSGYNSNNCAATDLHGNYENNADDWLISPSITLGTANEIKLYFWEWFQFESGCDYGRVKVSADGGTSWTELSVRDGSSDWRETEIDLTTYENETIKIAFNFTSDYSVTYNGWYIDDIRIDTEEPEPLTATMISLNSQNFPFIYMNVAVDSFGVGTPYLTQSNFEVYENGILQTDYFEVIPPETGGGSRRADIVFLMDNSGSMSQEINAVSNNVLDFVDNLVAGGIDFALGLCRFGGYENSGYPIIEDNGILTEDANYFKYDVWDRNYADGSFEPGWDALYTSAITFSFRPGAQKIFILITDENVTGDGNFGNYSQLDATTILQNNSITMFALIELDSYSIQDFGTIAEETNGAYFDIYSNFDDILDYISYQVANTYLVRYYSSDPQLNGITRYVEIVVSYFGYQDTATGSYMPGAVPQIQRTQATIDLHNQAWAQGTQFAIEVEITDDIQPYLQSATLYYKNTSETTYQSVPMYQTSRSEIWEGIIPPSAVNTPGLDYYITATDGESTSSDPSVEPMDNPYQLAILPNEAPQITHIPVATLITNIPIDITANVTDYTNSLESVQLFYRKTGQLTYQVTDMYNTYSNNYEGEIPGSYSTADGVDYFLKASDNFGVHSFHGTPDDPHQIEPEYDLGFRPNPDGWKFSNSTTNMWPQTWWQQFDYTQSPYPSGWPNWPIYASSWNFPDWPLFVDAFGEDQCYWNPPPGWIIYSPVAVLRWSRIKGNWGGSCFGFAISSFLAFDNKTTFLNEFPLVGNFNTLYELDISDNRRKCINQLWIYQTGENQLNHINSNKSKTPIQTLNETKQMMLSTIRDDKILVFFNQNGSGGHAVNPYYIEKDSNNQDLEYIYIYDNNWPSNVDKKITINTNNNTWSYFASTNAQGQPVDWGGSEGLFLMDQSSNYLEHPILVSSLPSKDDWISNNRDVNFIEIYNSTSCSIEIEDQTGLSIGYTDLLAYNNFNEGIPIIPITGNSHPPIGYYIPSDSYSVNMQNFSDSLTYFSVFTDSLVFNYQRNDAGSQQTDYLVYNEGLTINNQDSYDKTCNLGLIVIGDNDEKVFEINNCEISIYDSLNINAVDQSNLFINNAGINKNYDLRINYVSAEVDTFFEHSGINLMNNTSHKIVPNWFDLDIIPVYIDEDNNGIIDDTLYVENQYSSGETPETHGSLKNENIYIYPNPFNPEDEVGTIRYSLSEDGKVTIKIYDVSGSLVTTLIEDEPQYAEDEQSIEWNGKNDNGKIVANGVYFYVIESSSGERAVGKAAVIK